MKARSRRLSLGLTTIFTFFLLAGTAAAAPSGSASQRLIETYAPILMLREEQKPPCETSAEQYQPTSVETVLGNPRVELTEADKGKELPVMKAPTADDIAGLGDAFHLDLPGDPLGDTCVYAKDFSKLRQAGRAPAVTYAHIAHEDGREGLAVQYWFFWYFNQFNDLHEGDWEGMQIAFESSDPAQALREGPSEMIVFQHAGGERAGWEDGKVQKQGEHPIVYPAAGSHATFYDSAVYVQNGQGGSGVGCDNTTEPLRRVEVTPILIPDKPSANGPFRWLTYKGHWGQLEKGFNNGPTGPLSKTQWQEPFSWMGEQRSSSPRLPGGSIVGPQVTKAFCGAVASASDLINLEARSRLAAVLTVVIAIALIALFVGATRWRPVDLENLRRRRAFGQLVRAARQLYGRHWAVLIGIGLTAIPIVGGVNVLSNLVAGDRGVDDTAGTSGLHLAGADVLQYIGRPIASAVVAAVVIVFVRALVAGTPIGFVGSYRAMGQRFWRVVGGELAAALGVGLLALTVIGLPWAIWKYVCWQFVQQEILFEDKPIREAFRGSSNLVRGRWWHTVRVAGFLWLVSIVTGPVVGFALIFSSFSLLWINIIGSLVFALLVPYVALGRTLLYFDLQARAEQEPAKPRRSWLPRRSRRAASAPVDTTPRPAESG